MGHKFDSSMAHRVLACNYPDSLGRGLIVHVSVETTQIIEGLPREVTGGKEG